MQLIKLTHIRSTPVSRYNRKPAKKEALEMIKWMDKENGNFEGSFGKAFAIAHCQVSEKTPFAFFVVDKELVEQKAFPAQVIFNARIVEAEMKISNHEGQVIDNVFVAREACMSFPHRKEKNFERFFQVKVEFEILTMFGFKKIRQVTKGLVAQIFQHEIDHANGINIHFGDSDNNVIPIKERVRYE